MVVVAAVAHVAGASETGRWGNDGCSRNEEAITPQHLGLGAPGENGMCM